MSAEYDDGANETIHPGDHVSTLVVFISIAIFATNEFFLL